LREVIDRFCEFHVSNCASYNVRKQRRARAATFAETEVAWEGVAGSNFVEERPYTSFAA